MTTNPTRDGDTPSPEISASEAVWRGIPGAELLGTISERIHGGWDACPAGAPGPYGPFLTAEQARRFVRWYYWLPYVLDQPLLEHQARLMRDAIQHGSETVRVIADRANGWRSASRLLNANEHGSDGSEAVRVICVGPGGGCSTSRLLSVSGGGASGSRAFPANYEARLVRSSEANT